MPDDGSPTQCPAKVIAGPQTGGIASPPSFIFDHLQKTGGTTMRAVFEQLFGRAAVSPNVIGRSARWAAQHYAQYRVIIGHFAPAPGDDKTDRHTVTLLRHPVDRVLSYYNYLRHDVSAEQGGPAAVIAKSCDLADFLGHCDETRDAHVCNFMTRHFAMRLSREIMDDAHCLSLAQRALAGYQFVGLTERLAETADLFCYAYGLSALPEVPRLNVTSVRTRYRDLDRRTRDRLAELNRLDLALYETAERLFVARQRAALRDCILVKECGFRQVPATPQSARPPAETPPAADTPPPEERLSENFGDRMVEIRNVRVTGLRSGTDAVAAGEDVVVSIGIAAHIDVPALTVGIEIRDQSGATAFGTNTHHLGRSSAVVASRDYEIRYRFPANLEIGCYAVGISLHTGADHTGRCFHWWDGACSFFVVDYGGAPFVGHSRLPVKVRWISRTPPVTRLLAWFARRGRGKACDPTSAGAPFAGIGSGRAQQERT